MSDQWYLYRDSEQTGPFSWEELYTKASMHTLKGDDMVWHEGMEGWARVDTVPGLLPVAAVPPPPPSSPPPFPDNTGRNGVRDGYQQRDAGSPPRAGNPSHLPPRGRYAKDPAHSYDDQPIKTEKAGGGLNLKFRVTPVFRINWIAIALLGIIVLAALIARLLGL